MKICAIGDNCIDFYPATDESFPGGNPVNVAVYFKRLGGESSYIGAVGTDRFGKVMVDGLSAKGVDVSRVHVDEGKTAVTIVEIVNGDRVFGDYDEGVMEHFKLTAEDIDFILKHDMVVSGFWGHCNDNFKEFHEKGILTAFDFATKLDDSSVEEIVGYMDYAFFSYDDGDMDWIREYMKKMHSHGSKMIITTMGEKGSLVYDGEKFYEFGIFPCEVVDTIGAGDSYIAGFLHGILEGLTIPECMEKGARNSTVTIAYKGAW